MALTLPNTVATAIANVDGNKLELNATLGEIVPSLAIPTFLDVAKNTSGTPPSDKWTSMRFFMQAKNSATVTYRDGKLVVEPSSITAKTITIEPVQLTPASFAEKLKIHEMDLKSPGLEGVLAKATGTWMENMRVQLEIALLNKLVTTSYTFNEKIKASQSNMATSFENGAHYQQQDISTFDQAKSAFKEAIRNFENIGLPNAKTTYDANNKFTTGILRSDILALVSYDFLDLITSDKVLLSNDVGYNEIFKNMGVRRVMGVDMLPLQTMPDGVHFILITTGQKGTFAYESVAGGLGINVVQDPNWSGDLRADLNYSYIIGIVNEQYCIASVAANYTVQNNITWLSSNIKISNATRSVNESFDEDTNQTKSSYSLRNDDSETTGSKVRNAVDSVISSGKKIMDKFKNTDQTETTSETVETTEETKQVH